MAQATTQTTAANKVNAICPKCEGAGRLWEYGHVLNGVCFKCNGTGRAMASEAQAAKTQARVTQEAERKAAARREAEEWEAAIQTQMTARGWGEKGRFSLPMEQYLRDAVREARAELDLTECTITEAVAEAASWANYKATCNFEDLQNRRYMARFPGSDGP